MMPGKRLATNDLQPSDVAAAAGSTQVPGREVAGDARARSERTLVQLYALSRGIFVVQGVLVTVVSWSIYRYPLLVLAVLFVAAAQTWWICSLSLRRGSVSSRPAASGDLLLGVAGLLALGAATTPVDRTSWVNWFCPFSYAIVCGLAIALPWRRAALGVAVLAATYLLTCASSLTGGGNLSATALANTVSYGGFLIATVLFVRGSRRGAAETDAARAAAVAAGRHLATEQERNRQHRLLHDSALQTLEAVARGWDGGTGAGQAALRVQAHTEALRLRRALSGAGDVGALTVGDQVMAVVTDIGVDLRVEVVPSPALQLPAGPASDALSEAIREALRNVVKHSGVHTAVLCLDWDRGELVATVRDHGCGFDPAGGEGFGLTQSIRGRLAECGGDADVRSEPGAGTRVRLRVPA